MFAPTRGLSQLTTAFLAEQLQGIRRRPLPACHITHLPFPVSDAARKRPRQISGGLGGAQARRPRTDVKDPSSQRRERNAAPRLYHLSTIGPAASRRLTGNPLRVARRPRIGTLRIGDCGGMGTRTPDLWLAKPSL